MRNLGLLKLAAAVGYQQQREKSLTHQAGKGADGPYCLVGFGAC
jgi:hypothetical protein